ncbi:MAG: TonB-dependent receptor domain-containing protein, partial [Vicinamibacterales bacterium]
PAVPGGADHDHGEAAWRLRHLKRSVLKDAEPGVLTAEDDDSFWEDSFETIGRAMGHSARIASSLFTELPLSGEVNFLTTTSFDQPQELLSMHVAPRSVAFVSLNAPMGAGDWNVRGAMTQGDLASWVIAGSYVRRSPASHQYEAGLMYSMQSYRGGNPAALAAVADGSRNAAAMYAYDLWTLRPGVTFHYGARYAKYDYLEDGGLFSPRLGVTFAPTNVLRVRFAASRREMAPGAEEFIPQAALNVWLPPERTFSPVSTRRGFQAERVQHYEVAAEHDMGGGVIMGLRAFRQRVNDQMVTLFGVSLPAGASADIGHYYVASGGHLEARGWGVGVSRTLTGRVRGSLDYTRTDADWIRRGPDWRVLSLVAPSANRAESETVHDLTTSLQTQIPMTATRVYVLYKLNSGFTTTEAIDRSGRLGARFDVQINQALPFLNFTAAQWEMLLTVRNLFREDLLDASMYDELLVLKPPKRIVGGVTVRF